MKIYKDNWICNQCWLVFSGTSKNFFCSFLGNPYNGSFQDLSYISPSAF